MFEKAKADNVVIKEQVLKIRDDIALKNVTIFIYIICVD